MQKQSELRGCVDVVKNNTISGWCYTSGEPSPTIVKLYIDDIVIRSRRADNDRADIEKQSGSLTTGFNFFINPKLLNHLPSAGTVRVVAGPDEKELPFAKGVTPVVNGGSPDGGNTLRKMLSDKWHIDHWGQLQISFAKEPGKKERYLDFYCEVSAICRSISGIDLYLTGGNLLGIIREFDFIPHDDDIDASFCVRANSVADAAEQFFAHFDKLVPRLLALGYTVSIVNVCQFHVFRGGAGLDIFMGWIDDSGQWYRYTGAGGNLGTKQFRTRKIDFLGRPVLIPQYAERELDLTYGENWKNPDPHFFWRTPTDVKIVMNDLQNVALERVAQRKAELTDPSALIARLLPGGPDNFVKSE